MLRQCKGGNLSVKSLLQKIDARDRELECNLTTLFSNIRGTRQYWYSRQTELNVMMKEFGPPTWFVTLSSAEYTWTNLHDHLQHINSDVPGIMNFTPGETCVLDPVSVCQHFHNRFHSILRNLILCKDNPVLGPVAHHFWRVEYQMRGAPHAHLVLWIDKSPLIGRESNEEVLKFIQRYITCSVPNIDESPTLNKLVNNFQRHKCGTYCQRKYKTRAGQFLTRCRFGFPRASRDEAIMNDLFSCLRQRSKRQSTKRLYELRRTTGESYINDYNPTILFQMEANVDVQYIGESSWSLAKYVTSYVTKAEKVELQDVWQEMSNKSLGSRLWTLGLKALTNRSVGAYEASDRLLGKRLYGKSATIRFINTNEPSNRNRNLKPYKQLLEIQELNPDSNDLYTNSYLDDYYPNRPDELEDCCLFEFMKWYDRMPMATKVPEGWLSLRCSLGLLKRRTTPYAINHYQHNPSKSESEKEKWCHAMLMMFKKWRNEDELMGEGCQTYQESFNKVFEVLPAMKEYIAKTQKEEEVVKSAEAQLAKESQESHEEQHGDDIDNAVGFKKVIEAEQAMEEVIDGYYNLECKCFMFR